MIHIKYNEIAGLVLPDSAVIKFANDFVIDNLDSDEVHELTIASKDLIYSFCYAMKQNQKDHTKLTIEYCCCDKKIWLDDSYNLSGYYAFSGHTETILMGLF